MAPPADGWKRDLYCCNWNPRTKPINKKPTSILLQRNPANFKFHFTEVWKIYWKLRLAKIKLSIFSPNINYWERQLKINSFFWYSCKICIRSKSMPYGCNKKWLTFLRDFSPKKQYCLLSLSDYVHICIHELLQSKMRSCQPAGYCIDGSGKPSHPTEYSVCDNIEE